MPSVLNEQLLPIKFKEECDAYESMLKMKKHNVVNTSNTLINKSGGS